MGIYSSHTQLNQTASTPRQLLSHPTEIQGNSTCYMGNPTKNNVTENGMETVTTIATIIPPTETVFVCGDGPYHSFSLTYQGFCALAIPTPDLSVYTSDAVSQISTNL